MDDPVRIVVAGAGGFGREHLRRLAATDTIAVVGVADLDPRAAETAARDFSIDRHGTDALSLASALRPDGLIIATPGSTHVAIARQALALGIPVLVEKPVAMTSADAASLADAAGTSAGFVLPGHVLRFSRPHRQFVAIALSDEVGPILSITARRHRDDDHARRYAEDAVLMTMIHDIDLALWITGADAAPDRVFATRRPAGTSRSETLAVMSSTGGPIWRLSTAWTFNEGSCPPDRIEVVGERGGVELDVEGTIRVYGAKPRRIDVTIDYDDALAAEHSYFAGCLRPFRQPAAVTIGDATSGLSIADATLKSLRTGKVEEIKPR